MALSEKGFFPPIFFLPAAHFLASLDNYIWRILIESSVFRHSSACYSLQKALVWMTSPFAWYVSVGSFGKIGLSTFQNRRAKKPVPITCDK